MNRSFISRHLLENPHVGRQIAAHFSAFSLGFMLLFVSGSLFLTGFLVFRTFFLDDRSGVPEGAAGSILHFWNSVTVWGLLAVLLPVRVSGAIDGLRADKAFDQVVVTGWSPHGLHFGNWALGFGYALLVLLVSLPFQLFAWSLGGVGAGDLAATYAVLALHANVIIGVAMALGSAERERAAAPLTMGAFLFAGFLGLLGPIPGVISEITPVRLLARLNAIEPAGMFQGSTVLFFWTVPDDVYPYLLWALILVPVAITLALGPSHRFSPGLDNFGNVVLPGDRKRRFFRRPRLVLTRRVELAFFYENRPRWLAGWDFLLRRIPLFLGVAFAWGIVLGKVHQGSPSMGRSTPGGADEAGLVSLFATAAILFFALLSLGDTRHRIGLRERIGRLEVPRGALLSACAGILLAGYAALHLATLEAVTRNETASGDLMGAVFPSTRAAALEAYTTDYRTILAALLCFLLNVHLLGKVLSRFAASTAGWGMALMVLSAGILFAPPFLFAGIEEGWLSPRLFPIVYASPVVLFGAGSPSFIARAEALGFDGAGALHYYLMIHTGIAAVLSIVLVFLAWRQTRAREQKRTLPPGQERTAGPGKAGGPLSPIAAALVGFAILGSGDRARAAEELPLEIEVIRGFDGRLFLGDEVDFFTVVARNRSSRAIRGSLRIELDEEQSLPSRSFEAPPGTSTVIRWSEEPGSSTFTSSGRLVIEAPEGRRMMPLPPPGSLGSGADGGPPPEGRWYLLVSEDGRLPSAVDPNHSWVRAKPLVLPEDFRPYLGASAVFLEGVDLSRWTKRQRDALEDYLRLGGTVVFCGPLDRATLKGAGEWEDLLAADAPIRSLRVVRGGTELIQDELLESTVAWRLDAAGTEPEAPLLRLRRVGPGALGRLSFGLASAPGGLPAELDGFRPFWTVFAEKVPSSRFLSVVFLSSRRAHRLLDTQAIAALAGYFLLYAAALGPALAVIFRKKSRRRWLPVYLVGVPILFSLSLPLMNAVLHAMPSYAILTRTLYFGPGTRRGVVQASLQVRSSGRQRHQVRLRGKGLLAGSIREGGIFAAGRLPSLEAGPGAEPASILDVPLTPWGERTVFILGDARRERPIGGKVIYDARTGIAAVRGDAFLDGFSPIRGRVLLIHVREDGSHAEAAVPLEELSGELSFECSPRIVRALPPLLDTFSRLTLAKAHSPRAILVIEVTDIPFNIESDDLAFEREETLAKAKSDPYLANRDGKFFFSLRRALILQELDLEIR